MKTDDLCLVETLKEIERRAVGARCRNLQSPSVRLAHRRAILERNRKV